AGTGSHSTSVLHFFSKLRRHASLEGAGPYFRRWKFDSSHRAASLDAKGSPKRRPFQRQRAASETTDHTEDDSSLGDEVIESVPHTPIQTSGLQFLSAESLSRPDLFSPTNDHHVLLEAEARGRADSGSSLSFMIRQESSEAPPSLYRDIWSLRASLEQYASSDQSSTDRESIRSDADSISSLGGAGARVSGGNRNRKLLQMDSGYASIELMSPLMKAIPSPSSPHQPRLRRRDYSIDEKTDALFNEFLRHDPRFDQQDSPIRSRHRSRVHLRKQWQRHKQYSDPGSSAGGRYSPSLERQRFTPLRRGDSAGYPLDTSRCCGPSIQPGGCSKKFKGAEQNLCVFLIEFTGGGLKAFCVQNVCKLQAKTSRVRFRNGSKYIYKTKNIHSNSDFSI
uniref:CACN subunit beta associated regulatory protein b n=1 Tax=Mola mola TaxID=94237 RepID=A0A3Q3WAT9_MOLML